MELIIKLKPVATNPFDGSKPPTDIEERAASKSDSKMIKGLRLIRCGQLDKAQVYFSRMSMIRKL